MFFSAHVVIIFLCAYSCPHAQCRQCVLYLSFCPHLIWYASNVWLQYISTFIINWSTLIFDNLILFWRRVVTGRRHAWQQIRHAKERADDTLYWEPAHYRSTNENTASGSDRQSARSTGHYPAAVLWRWWWGNGSGSGAESDVTAGRERGTKETAREDWWVLGALKEIRHTVVLQNIAEHNRYLIVFDNKQCVFFHINEFMWLLTN